MKPFKTGRAASIDSPWYAHSPGPTPLGLAVHLGWLNGELFGDGIAIKSLPRLELLGDEALRRELKLTKAFRQGSIAPIAWARSRGAAMSIIGMTWVDEPQQIVALPASGLRRIEDLKGRRIAVPRRIGDSVDMFRSGALHGISRILGVNGMSVDDVELVFATDTTLRLYETETTALLAGQADAIYLRGLTGVLAAQRLDAVTLYDLQWHPDPRVRRTGPTLRPLTVHNALAENFPDIVSGFLRLVVEAGRWARTHPVEYVRYVAGDMGVDAGLVRRAYGGQPHLNMGLDLAPASIQALGDFKDFLFEQGFLAADFDVAAWIRGDFLDGLGWPSVHVA